MFYSYQGLKPKIDETAYIAPGVHVVGDVEIGEYSSVWFNSVIRGDINSIKIGRYTNIQDGSVVHVDSKYPTVIGDYVLAGHKVILHGCKIGDGAMIGMSAVILDNAVIGKNSLVGAGTLVKEGQEIPPGVLAVGSPARVVRELKAEEIERIRKVTDIYAKRAQEYKTSVTSY